MHAQTLRLAVSVTTISGFAMALVSTGVMLPGCEKKKPPPAPPPAPPPPPPSPDPIQIDPVMQSMRPDARVQFPQDAAPVDESLAKAIIDLANAFAKGDSTTLGNMLAPAAKADLAALVDSGEWDEEAAKIEAVRLLTVSEMPGDALPSTNAQVYWTVQEPSGAYVIGWNALRINDAWVFDGTGSTANVRKRATEWDGASIDDLTRTTVTRATSSSSGGVAANPMDEMAAFLYFMNELGARAAKVAGTEAELAAAEAQAMQMASQAAPGLDAAAIKAQSEALRAQGKAAVDRGVWPGDSKVKSAIEAVKAVVIGRMDDEALYKLSATILNVDVAKIRALFGAAAPPSSGGAPAPIGG